MPLTKSEFVLSVVQTTQDLRALPLYDMDSEGRSNLFFEIAGKLNTLCSLLERKEGDTVFNELFNKLMGVKSNESERNETETTREQDASIQRRNTLHPE